jgi:hypothetical protein
MEELNRLKPSFFYNEVAKRTGVERAIVEDIYTKYLSRVSELSKTETKLFIKGLGTFERHPNNILTRMYDIFYYINKHMEYFQAGLISPKQYAYLNKMESYMQDLEKLKFKYKYVEKSVEKYWSNCRGVEEFFDREGRIRKDFIIKEGDLREMPISLEECEDFGGIFEQEPETLQLDKS